jgi:hypothetical protein
MILDYLKKTIDLYIVTDKPFLQLFVGGFMSYLHYLCLFVDSGVQHILTI